MAKKYTPEQIQSALQHEGQMAELLAKIARAESYIKDTDKEIMRLERKKQGQIEAKEKEIMRLERKKQGQIEAKEELESSLLELEKMKSENQELFDLFASLVSTVQEKRTVKTTVSGRMAKISTDEKVLLIRRALDEFKKNRNDHIWADKDSVPLYFIKDFIERVKETEIGNITIWMKKAIQEGNFKLSGKTRSRAIRIN
jgi:predicted RNase H-like nuclease (RuvC/YqgF family)